MHNATQKYPVYAIPVNADIPDGSHTTASVEAKLRADQVAANEAAAATVSTTTPGPKASKIS